MTVEPVTVEPATVAVGARCLAVLESRGETLAVAESLTAGLVAATLAAVPGASNVLRGGIVAYSTDVKTGVLDVAPHIVETYGVVSAECAGAMAAQACVVLDADVGVSTTGVAGPDSQDGQPVGRVFVAVARRNTGVEVHELTLSGGRQQIRGDTVAAALTALAAAVGSPGEEPRDSGR